jgi:hypothetical protein
MASEQPAPIPGQAVCDIERAHMMELGKRILYAKRPSELLLIAVRGEGKKLLALVHAVGIPLRASC